MGHGDTDSTNGPVPGDVGNRESSASGVNAEDVRVGLAIRGKNVGNHLGFKGVAGGEERANSTVDEAAGENLTVLLAAFTTIESGRDSSDSALFLTVLNGEGHEACF